MKIYQPEWAEGKARSQAGQVSCRRKGQKSLKGQRKTTVDFTTLMCSVADKGSLGEVRGQRRFGGVEGCGKEQQNKWRKFLL